MNMLHQKIDTAITDLKPIVSPVHQALSVSLFEGREGLSVNTNCTIFETRINWFDLAAHFECEANSDVIPENLKHQRDVSLNDSRVKAMIDYVNTRPDSVFPSITIFVNEVELRSSFELPNGDVVHCAQIPAMAERLICDGQGRTTTIKAVLAANPDWHNYTVGVKLICTNTKSLYDASNIIRQTFSDMNGQTKKPDTSLSIYFDLSKPYSRLVKEVIESEVEVEGKTLQLRHLIALNGDIKMGQLWTLKQFSDSFPILFGSTAGGLNKSLSEAHIYESTKELGVEFYRKVLNKLPLSVLFTEDEKHFKLMHKQSMFTKALFSKSLGYVGRSLYEEAIANGSPIDFSKLDRLKTLPLNTLDDEVWLKSQVCWVDDSIAKPVTKIHKASDKKIARVLCQQCRIFPTLDI